MHRKMTGCWHFLHLNKGLIKICGNILYTNLPWHGSTQPLHGGSIGKTFDEYHATLCINDMHSSEQILKQSTTHHSISTLLRCRYRVKNWCITLATFNQWAWKVCENRATILKYRNIARFSPNHTNRKYALQEYDKTLMHHSKRFGTPCATEERAGFKNAHVRDVPKTASAAC